MAKGFKDSRGRGVKRLSESSESIFRSVLGQKYHIPNLLKAKERMEIILNTAQSDFAHFTRTLGPLNP